MEPSSGEQRAAGLWDGLHVTSPSSVLCTGGLTVRVKRWPLNEAGGGNDWAGFLCFLWPQGVAELRSLGVWAAFQACFLQFEEVMPHVFLHHPSSSRTSSQTKLPLASL